MSYIVVYQRADGSSGLEECPTLDVAVVAAERLRNVDGVESPRILRTEEIQFDFRPYYRVEVATDSATPADTDTPPSPLASVPESSMSVIDAPAANDASIDPWAAVHSSAQGDAPDRTDEVTESVDTTDVQAEDTPDVEDQPSASRGLFSGEHVPELPTDLSDVDPLAEDASDAVPPRRGLFGR